MHYRRNFVPQKYILQALMARLSQNRLISKDMENALQGIASLGFDIFSKLFLLGSCYKTTDNRSRV